MATTGTPNVNKPTDLEKKEADVNRKLQIYGIISAFQNGKVPSVCRPRGPLSNIIHYGAVY
jgi:hypothetical protein